MTCNILLVSEVRKLVSSLGGHHTLVFLLDSRYQIHVSAYVAKSLGTINWILGGTTIFVCIKNHALSFVNPLDFAGHD